jgi:F-type H+-transporting ATPase subunit b
MLESLNVFKVIQVALNLIILYVILRKILFKPVTQFMDNRVKSIKDSIDNAEKAKVEAAELKQKYEDLLKAARIEAIKITDEAYAKAEIEHEKITAEAQKESQRILQHARQEIDREREQMLKDIRSQVAGLALAAASKVMEANMDTESNRKLVSRFIDEAGAA